MKMKAKTEGKKISKIQSFAASFRKNLYLFLMGSNLHSAYTVLCFLAVDGSLSLMERAVSREFFWKEKLAGYREANFALAITKFNDNFSNFYL